jgi:predicted nucleic acid-binding protein
MALGVLAGDSRACADWTPRIASAEIVWPGPELTGTYVELRDACARRGHALSQRVHEADRWIASTALWLGVPLVAHDSSC